VNKFVLTPEEAVKVENWITMGRGVLIWRSKDLSISRPDMITPGDATQAPHWAYVGQPEKADIDTFVVVKRTKVDLPPEWFPPCPHCNGKGTRSVQEIADIRGESVKQVRKQFQDDNRIVMRGPDDFDCWSCRGSGHTVEAPTFRVKRLPPYKGGGMECSATGINKCVQLCRKMEEFYGVPDIKWDWEFIGNGMGQAVFFTEEEKPFSCAVEQAG
jgi:hypothetical protein